MKAVSFLFLPLRSPNRSSNNPFTIVQIRLLINVCYTKAMKSNTLVWVGVFVGSTVGSFIPDLWHAGFLSMSSLIFSTIGGLLGVWAGAKLSGY